MNSRKKMKLSFNAPVTLVFTGLCFLATLLGAVSGGSLTKLLFMTYHSPLISPLTYLRLFTHVIGHSGWAHFIGNASYLLLLGPMLEEKYGAKKLLAVIAVTALFTGLLNYFLFPSSALCGASGIVFAFILLTSFTGFREGEIPVTFILVAVIFIGQQVVQGLFVRDNISNLSHIAGGAVGSAAGYFLNRKSGV